MNATDPSSTTWMYEDYEYYEYYENFTGHLGFCNHTEDNEVWSSVTPVFFCLVIVLSLLGNNLVVVILAKYENLRSLTNALILNLAASDLLFTAGLPFWTYYHMYGWTLGEAACKIVVFVFNVGYHSSGALLVLMTVQRFLGVMRPLSPLVSAAGGHSVLVSLLIWTLSIAASSPSLFAATVLDGTSCEIESKFWRRWEIYQQNLLFLLTALVFLVCYSQITCRLLRASRLRRNNKTVKLIFSLLVVFFLGWGPFNVVIFLTTLEWPPALREGETLESRCRYQQALDYAFYISRILAYSHCCLNPVFYVLVGVKFRNHLKRVTRSWSGRGPGVPSRQTRLTFTSVSSGDDFAQ